MKRRSKSACFAPPLLLGHLPKVQKPRYCSAGMTAFSRFEGCKTVMFSDKFVVRFRKIVALFRFLSVYRASLNHHRGTAMTFRFFVFAACNFGIFMYICRQDEQTSFLARHHRNGIRQRILALGTGNGRHFTGPRHLAGAGTVALSCPVAARHRRIGYRQYTGRNVGHGPTDALLGR